MRANKFGEVIRSPNEGSATKLSSPETMWELDENFGAYELVFKASISGNQVDVDNALDVCEEAKNLFYH